MDSQDLIVFVTELARRQYIRRGVLQKGFVDASRYLTFTRLREICLNGARQAGLLKSPEMSDFQRKITLHRAASTASAEFNGKGSLGALSVKALTDTLENLVEALSPLARGAQAVSNWLLKQEPATGKLRQLGLLYNMYRRLCETADLADIRDANAAILTLLQGDRKQWPPLLASLPARLIFRSMRWLNPFEEEFISTLKQQLGDDRVRVFSALPPAHAEKMEDHLAARIRSEVMAGSDEAWASWTENVADALEMDDPALALDSQDRFSFLQSVGLYGEIEDLARRIRWEMDQRGVAPERIALVVRNLSDYTDAVTHVFKRFDIPCFFRRGLPVVSFPLVKTVLSLFSLPPAFDRNRFCDLLQSPMFRWPGFQDEAECRELAHDILASGLPPHLEVDELRRTLTRYYREVHRAISSERAQSRIKAVTRLMSRLKDLANPAPLAGHARHILQSISDLVDLDSTPPVQAAGMEALETTLNVIRQFEEDARSIPEKYSLADFLDLLQRSLENAVVPAGHTDESGVWILNPYDTAGLRFDVVLMAGLNEGVFPALSRQDSLFSDEERQDLREAVRRQSIELPRWALPVSSAQIMQESILFLVSLGMARERFVLSYQACDTDGREMVAGEFFRSLWTLAGWPAQKKIKISDYDLWRMEQLGTDSHIVRHVKNQQRLPPYQRIPMPGESYLAGIPLPFCRAADEARQRVARGMEEPAIRDETDRFIRQAGPAASSSKPGKEKPGVAPENIQERIRIELARDSFFNSPAERRLPAEPYCGKLGSPEARQATVAWLVRHPEFSATAFETLAKCRYRFLMGHICRLGELRTQEEAPDILDRGKIIHRILDRLYGALAGMTNHLEKEYSGTLSRHSSLVRPGAWAVETAAGQWALSTEGAAHDRRSLPLVAFGRADVETYIEFARAICDDTFTHVEKSGTSLLGDPGVWSTEKPKIRQIISNYVRFDAENAGKARRYPALFELKYGQQPDRAKPNTPPLILEGEGKTIKLHGQVDRIDLVFDEQDHLANLLVIDYKTPGRGGLSLDDYAQEIVDNLNCQLPIYGLAAQQFIFGRHDEADLNALTEVVYHIQDRDLDQMARQFDRRIPLNHTMEDGRPLIDVFIERLLQNLEKLEHADFSVDPLDCTYCEFKHICRVDVNALAGMAEGGA